MDTPAIDAGHGDEQGLVCPGCGYNLFAISSERCPECGLAIDRTVLGQSQIPWTRRHEIGRFRGFWRTVLRASIRPKKIALEVNRPVSYSDARLFQCVCIAMAWVPIMAWVIGGIGWGDFPRKLSEQTFDMTAAERIGSAVVIGIALLLFLFFITGLPSYFFHPADMPVIRQNRSVALSYYASASLAWVWIVAVLPLPLFFIDIDHITPQQETWIVLPLSFACELAIPILAFMIWSNAMALLKHATHCAGRRRWAMGLILPLAWALLAAICLIGIPAVTLFVAAVAASFG